MKNHFSGTKISNPFGVVGSVYEEFRNANCTQGQRELIKDYEVAIQTLIRRNGDYSQQ